MSIDCVDHRSKAAPRWRFAAALLIAAAPPIQASEDGLNLFTRGEGLHAVTLQELADVSGYSQSELQDDLATGRYALVSGGALRAWHYDTEASTLYFAAEGYDTEHTDRNAYRLSRDSEQAAHPMPVVQGEGPAPGVPGAFSEVMVLEQDNAYAPWALYDPDGRYWFWDYVYAGTAGDRKRFPLDLPDPDPADCGVQPYLQVYLRGSSNLSPDGNHQVLGVLNPGTLAAPPEMRVQFDAFAEQVLGMEFAPNQLLPSGNELELVSELRPGVSLSLQRLDRIEARYCRRNLARDGQLWLHQVGPGIVTVGGLPGTDVAVIEAPSAEGATWREDLTLVPDGSGGYEVSFVAETPADFLIAAKEAAQTSEIESDTPSSLAAGDNRADYLILAPKVQMEAAAVALADYRRATLPAGSLVRIIWMQDIWDDFNQGRADPQAISAFLKAARSWRRVPTHVTVLGRGTLNHKGRPEHFPGESLIPVRMSTGPWGLFPSDNRYCDTDGDGVPEFACGRIPAESADDASDYVAKLKDFESVAVGVWMDSMIGVADDLDPAAGDFAGDAAQSEQQIADHGYTVIPLHFQNGDSVDQFRGNLIAALQHGAALVGYWGHGAATRLGDENFLPIEDPGPNSDLSIASLWNAPRLPVVTGLTCYAGNDAFPGFTAVSAALAGNPEGGAIAALMPTGMSLHASSVTLGDHFFDALAGEGKSVGDAAREAKTRAAENGLLRWELDLFDISGEPLVVLP